MASSRNLLVLLRNEFMSEQAIEQEVDCLNEILFQAESPEQFCIAHELVDRNRITRKYKKLLRTYRYVSLPAFRFLLNRN